MDSLRPPFWAGLVVRRTFLHVVDGEDVEGGPRPAIARSKTDSALSNGAQAEYEPSLNITVIWPDPCSPTATTPTEASPRNGSDTDQTGGRGCSPGIDVVAAFPVYEGSSNDKFANREDAKEVNAADMRTTLMLPNLSNDYTRQLQAQSWAGLGRLVVKRTFLDLVADEDVEGGPQPAIARSKTDSALSNGAPVEYEPEPCSRTATTPKEASPRFGSDADESGSPLYSPGVDHAAGFPPEAGSSNDKFAGREEGKEEVAATDMRTTHIPMLRNLPNNFTRQMPPLLAGQGTLVVKNTFLDVVDGEGGQPDFTPRSQTGPALWHRPPAEYELEPCSSTATTSTESSPRQGDDLDETGTPGIDHVAAFPAEDVNGADLRTTLMLRNLPNNYTRQMLLNMLDQAGFASNYDFVYLPHDFERGCGLGYAFVNLVSPELVPRFRETFEGYRDWVIPTAKVCQVRWSDPHQGLKANVRRYRNSPVMHPSVRDEYKPCVFEGGQPVPFPTSGRRLCKPQKRT